MAQQFPNDVAQPGSYREFYSTVGYQDGEPEPARLVSSYRFTDAVGGGERPTPANLKEQTFVLSERRPMTFLCLNKKPNTGVEVRVLHRMMRYFELPGDGGGLVDLSMGLLGDVRATQMPVVEVDNSHFSLILAGVRVPTMASMPDRLAAAPPGTALGPYAAGTPNTEVIRPRLTQVIPAKYAATLIHRDGVSPATAYQELTGQFAADGVDEACADVLSWLRVACTARGGAGDLSAVPAVALSFPLLLLPAAVSDYVAAKVTGELPSHRLGGGAPVRGGIDPMVTAVQQLTATMGEVGGRTTREPKGIMDAYRETYPVLLRYCQVNSVDELAPLWNRLARGSKGEQQSIIQQELTKVCVDRGLTPDLYCPAVTTSLKQMIASLNFVGNGPDDLGAGCQPFLVVYTSQAEHYRALDEANVANQLDQGTASASLADIRDIRDKEKVKLPRDLNQVSLTLRRFAILAHTLFQGPGDSNPFVKSMWLLGNKFHERLPHYLGHHQGLAGTPWWDVYASHVLRHVQINVFEYLQALQVSGGVGADMDAPEPPSFHELLRDLQRGCFHMSSSWLPLPAAVTADASTAFRGEANTVGTRTTRASTAASTTSGLTASTGGGRASSGASGATAPQGTYVANPARDPEFDTLQLRPQMRDLLRAHPPPANDAGNAFCVSWWGRGGCYTNCGRASTHRPFANPGERTRLLAHVRAHLVAPTAAAAAST
ncbi:hypothetical protein MHU86_3359 [Fragilaria crotonensis]|nr:hypothetical protein MHU86_3359 [Fragilaria crotonensis]